MTQHKRIAHHDHFSPSRVLFLSFPGVPWIWLQFFIYSSLIFFLTWGNDWQIMEQLKPDMRQWSVNNQRNLQPFQNQPSPHVCGHTAAHSWGQSKIYDWGDQITQGVNIVSVSSLWIWCLLVMWLWVCPHEIAQLSADERRDTRYCLVNQWNGVEIVERHRKCLCIVSWNPKTGAPGWVYIRDGNVLSPVIPAVALVSGLPYSRGGIPTLARSMSRFGWNWTL